MTCNNAHNMFGDGDVEGGGWARRNRTLAAACSISLTLFEIT